MEISLVRVRARLITAALAAVTLLGACDGALGAVSTREGEGTKRSDAAARASDLGAPGEAPASPPEQPTVPPERTTDPFRGLGTWIDIYDHRAWAHPERTVRAMRDRGIRTIYLQTSNFSRGRPFVHPEAVDRFLDAAARRGILVVAWYLPGFRDLAADLKRSIAAIRHTTEAGNTFDGFALDIESAEIRDHRRRTDRLLLLSERIRRIAGPHYELGAIVASPRRLRTDPSFWPSFPYRRLAPMYDAFLPMTYFTYRVSGREGAVWYTTKNITILRQETAGLNVRIHVIGGIASDASVQETRGFVEAVRSRNVVGASYYTFPLVRPDQWAHLSAIG